MNIIQPYERQLNAIRKAMPIRPLTLKYTTESLLAQTRFTLIGLGLLFSGIYIAITNIGKILEDRKIANNPINVPTAVVSGHCESSKIPFLKKCDITISNAGTTVKRDFSFFSFTSKNYDVKVITQQGDPKNMNVELATEHMMSRLIGLLVWLLMVWIGVLLMCAAYKTIPVTQRIKKLFNTPSHQPWELVALPVNNDSFENLKYNNTIDGQSKEMNMRFDDKNRKLFWLGNEDNLVVAIKAKDTQTVVPLLQNLNNIDLHKDEKQALLKAYSTVDIVVPNKKPK